MKKRAAIVSIVLALVLLISSLPMVLAESVFAYNYDNSVWVIFETQENQTVEELQTILQVPSCYIMDKQTVDGEIVYQLVAMNGEESVEDAIARIKTLDGVTNAGRNVYASDYCEKESYLTLNQTALEIPVGGIATLKVTDAHLVSDEKQKTGIMVAVDHQAVSFEQFRDLVKAMGNEDVGEEAFFYALYEDDYNWDKQADDLFLGMWGSNEYDHRYNAQSPIGKYLIPIDCFFLPTVEEIMNKFAEVPQFTDVRFAYEMAPSGIPAHEYWTVENGKIAGIADEKEDEFDQFYTVTVVGRQVGETVITVQHGGGSRICYATCTVKVVEQSPETPTDIIWGDVNEDTKVDAKDALQVLKYAVQKTELTAKQQLAAEVDGKEGINAKDALEILKYSVKKIEKFPIEEAFVTPTDVPPTDA